MQLAEPMIEHPALVADFTLTQNSIIRSYRTAQNLPQHDQSKYLHKTRICRYLANHRRMPTNAELASYILMEDLHPISFKTSTSLCRFLSSSLVTLNTSGLMSQIANCLMPCLASAYAVYCPIPRRPVRTRRLGHKMKSSNLSLHQ